MNASRWRRLLDWARRWRLRPWVAREASPGGAKAETVIGLRVEYAARHDGDGDGDEEPEAKR